MRFTFLTLFVVVLLGAVPAQAQSSMLDEPVPLHPEATLFELMSQIIPDLAVAADGTLTGTPPVLRHVSDEDWAGEPIEDLTIGEISANPFNANSEEMLALLVEIGQGMPNATLAVFDSQLKLVDVADVTYDQFNSFHTPTVVPIGPGDDILLTESYHFNSSQGYNWVTLLQLRDRQITLIDDIFLFTLRVCGYDDEQGLEVTSSGGAEGYWPITATVTATHTTTGEDCGESYGTPAPDGIREISVTYNWSASLGGYVADSDAFDLLYAEAEAKF